MRAVRSRDTKPEMAVRRLLHRLGYRYRLHRRNLPGTPDIVFGPRRKVIFVHGCFWHGHSCPRGARLPATNTDYWRRKINRNVQRHTEQTEQLRAVPIPRKVAACSTAKLPPVPGKVAGSGSERSDAVCPDLTFR